MNEFVKIVKGIKTTENGALAYSSTDDYLYDLFALGGAYRQRTDEDCIRLFKNAFNENRSYALKCLFYLRDVRGGQGERRFFRVCLKWLANNYFTWMKDNLPLIAEYGRWDDYYAFSGTALEKDMYAFLHKQLLLDAASETPSLLAKWLKSENASSRETKALAIETMQAFNLTPRGYRQVLSILRKRINVVEGLMSAGKWDEIQFDKIPSKAGLIYKNAFAKHDYDRYKAFAESKRKTVNASALYPYEIVRKALDTNSRDDVGVKMIEKYWDAMPDYTEGAQQNVMIMADTSGSMYWGSGSVAPIHMSVAMALYFADKCKGDFSKLFMTFESNPHFVTVTGDNLVEKAKNVYRAPWGGSTNLVGAFDLILDMARHNHIKQEDMPQTLVVVSDMEIDQANRMRGDFTTEMAAVREKWQKYGYDAPHIVYWNVNARNDTFLEKGNGVTCVSGCSPVLFKQIVSGKSGKDIMYAMLNSKRYENIYA